MTTLTQFQKKKIARVFSVLYDSDKDGFIEEEDFVLYLKKICEILKWEEGGEKYCNAKTTLERVWKDLLKFADTNEDAKVSKEEWLKMWTDCFEDLKKGVFPKWQKDYMTLMFDVNDKSGDDFIDEEEYTTFFSQFGVNKEDCHKAFRLLSGGQKITRATFADLWKQYLTSDDPSAPGNYLFGPDLE